MATLSLTQHFTVTLNGKPLTLGSLVTPQSITIGEGAFDTRKVVDDNYVYEVLWATGDGGLDTFSFLWFESDADVLLELRNDDATDEFAIIEVKADIPFVLNSDDMLANDAGASDITDGTETAAAAIDQIDQIAVQNNVADAAGDATVRLVLFS